jgi:beta-1,4-mannosyl-glycoprotein beta-1,4-N-acetylglucosaminyltransferase
MHSSASDFQRLVDMRTNPKIYDCFIFFNELDILDIRLNTLDKDVDYFVLVESTRTFTGQPKDLIYQKNRKRFARFNDRIIHVVVDDMPESADSTFTREEHQRSAIGEGLTEANPDDLIIVSDVDEIPKPEMLRAARENASGHITYFEGVYYHFYLNWRLIDRKDLMTSRMIEYRHFRDGWLVRTTKGRRSLSMPSWAEYLMWLPYAAHRHKAFLRRQICREGCWHFSFMMSPDEVRRKLTAYKAPDRLQTKDSRAEAVEDRISRGRSMFDSEIKVVSISELPDYVQKNTGKFKHMIDTGDAPS